MYYVYVIESLSSKRLYIGYSVDLRTRIRDHNWNRNRSTAHKGPWKLIYYEAYLIKKDALGREKFLKSGSGRRYINKQLKHYFSDD